MKFLKLALIQVAFFVNVNFILLGGDPLLSAKLWTGFSIKAGTRRLIATYFGIGSRLLCILFAAFLFFVCVQVFCLSLSSDFEFSLSYIVQNNQNNRDQISKLAGASLLNYRHVFKHVDIRVCNIDFGPALHGKTWLLREHASDSFLGLTPPY